MRRAPATSAKKDLIGRKVDADHAEVLRLYEDTKRLCAKKGLPPYMARNLKKSLACLYQVVNDGGIEFEHLYDLGV